MDWRLIKKSDIKSTSTAKVVKALNQHEVSLIAEVFEISRSSLYHEPVSQEEVGMPHFYQKSDDQVILKEIKAVISIRATYGYCRVRTMVNL